MAQSDPAPHEGLIEVGAGTPRDWQPAQLIGSGIMASLTCELLVRFRTDAPLTFDLMPSPRTAIVREFGYRLVEALETISRMLPDRRPQRACLSLQRAFAQRFVLPSYRVLESGKSIKKNAGLYRFEATRRVFKFEADGAPESLLICHVLAQRQHRTAERLLAEFVIAVGSGDEPESLRCDAESGLCLWSGSSGRWAGRAYREVLIAPPDVLPSTSSAPLPKVGSMPVDIDTAAGQQVLDRHRLDDMRSTRNVAANEEPYDAFDDRLYERSESDWDFVAGEIEDAYAAGRALDEEFIGALARKRLELAKTYAYSDRPGAGPTFESSLGIVRSIVNLHLAAINQYKAEGGHQG